MIGAHQTFNGSHDQTTPLFRDDLPIHGLGLATINLPTKFEVSISAHYKNMKSDTKCGHLGGLK